MIPVRKIVFAHGEKYLLESLVSGIYSKAARIRLTTISGKK
ncbi:hypothetical protein MGWOODY_XGa3002 [hydrothermal vent metagenome]|uniref:Uncharacterized protein n=1 Tax=hydrothermal vent metagenome TaxID=652676 RepID=A0A161K134_9ZZZZ